MPAGIAIRSLDRFLEADDRIVVLHLGLDRTTLDRLAACAARATFSEIDCSGLMHTAWKSFAFPQSTFLRLLIPAVLKDDLRCVYLDGDVLVRKDPRPLHDADLFGNAVGAVRNRSIPFLCSLGGVSQWRELSLPGSAPYFNAGVLVLDLELWRKFSISERATQYLQSYGNETSLADQTALNFAAVGHWLELDRGWNYVTYVAYYFMQQPELEPTDPAIAHFAGKSKPWTAGTQPMFSEEWHDFLVGSPWSDYKVPSPPRGARSWLGRQIKQVVRKLAEYSREA